MLSWCEGMFDFLYAYHITKGYQIGGYIQLPVSIIRTEVFHFLIRGGLNFLNNQEAYINFYSYSTDSTAFLSFSSTKAVRAMSPSDLSLTYPERQNEVVSPV